MKSLQELYDRLALPPEASAEEKRRRGRAFEKFLSSMLESEKLAPRIRLRPTGEEIDGSFYFESRTFLLEAKWHSDPLPASSIYQFKGKVDGKLVGTIGIFISMSGYSEDAVDALTTGKHLNIILFDRNDIDAALIHGFERVLSVKLRAAAEEGVVLYPFTSTVATVSPGANTKVLKAPTNEPQFAESKNQVVIVCEGVGDMRILNRLGQRILESRSLSGNLRTVVAHGKRGIPRVANAIYPLLQEGTSLVMVVDADGNAQDTERTIREQMLFPHNLIVVDPSIEVWFEPLASNPKEDLKLKAKTKGMPLDDYMIERIETADISTMTAKSSSLHDFQDAIVRGIDTPLLPGEHASD